MDFKKLSAKKRALCGQSGYIQSINGVKLGSSYVDKLKALDGIARRISQPNSYYDNLVCVVDSGHFAAAAKLDEHFFNRIVRHPDSRPKQWFKITTNNVEFELN